MWRERYASVCKLGIFLLRINVLFLNETSGVGIKPGTMNWAHKYSLKIIRAKIKYQKSSYVLLLCSIYGMTHLDVQSFLTLSL